MENFINTLIGYVVEFGKDLLIAIAIAVGGKFLIDFIMKLYKKSNKVSRLDETVHLFVGNILKFSLYAVLAITVIAVLGIPTASFITAIGSAGVALGLALQGSLSNFAGGVMLLIFKPFKVGDFVESAGVSGTVEAITIFYTYVVTGDNKHVCIPNGTLSNSVITNTSAKDERRVDMTVKVAGDSDIELVKDTLETLAKHHPSVIKEKDVYARVGDYVDGAIVFNYRVWVKSGDYHAVKADLLEQINEAFKIREIESPVKALDVTVNK